MPSTADIADRKLGRLAGCSLLSTIIIGMIMALFVVDGIDINLSADVEATARNMLDAELKLRTKAYVAALLFGLELLVALGFFLLLQRSGPLLAGWSLIISLGASTLALLGAVFAMNAAEIATDPAYRSMTNESQRLMLTGLQATANYTSFHLALVLSSVGNAGFFYLFLQSNRIPRIIAGWGLFASLFVATMIVARDFFAIFGHGGITAAFMLSNLIAMVSTGLYLAIKGVRIVEK